MNGVNVLIEKKKRNPMFISMDFLYPMGITSNYQLLPTRERKIGQSCNVLLFHSYPNPKIRSLS